jgi:HAD superfamily hydrolase (TIGR01509 family)
MKKLYIFDMDGVIIDSEPLYKEMNKKIFEELGAEFNEDEYNGFVGIAADKMWQHVKDKYKLRESVGELKELASKGKYSLLLNTELICTAGVTDLLREIKNKNHITCIASSSRMKNIKLIMEKTSLEHYFDFFIGGDDIEKGKPDPDIFLKARDTAGFPEENCIVIEDSNNGVVAAKRAGMKCAGFKNKNSGDQDLSLADIIIKDFSEENRKIILNL